MDHLLIFHFIGNLLLQLLFIFFELLHVSLELGVKVHPHALQVLCEIGVSAGQGFSHSLRYGFGNGLLLLSLRRSLVFGLAALTRVPSLSLLGRRRNVFILGVLPELSCLMFRLKGLSVLYLLRLCAKMVKARKPLLRNRCWSPHGIEIISIEITEVHSPVSKVYRLFH